MPRGKRVPSFLLIFLALPSINADVVSLVQKGMSLEFLEAQIDINEIVPDYDDEYESSSNFSTIARRPLGGAMEDFATRMSRDDKAILAALKSIEDMDTNLASYIDPADVRLPCSIALSSARINFLSKLLFKQATRAADIKNTKLTKVGFLRDWAASIISNSADSIQQTLFNIDYLFENIVGDVGQQLRQSSQSNPAHLTAFLQFMRSLQLKGHILWGAALDIISKEKDAGLKALEEFAVKAARQSSTVNIKEDFMKILGGGATVGVKSMLYESYLRCADKFDEPINTQSRYDLWEHMTIEPADGGFHIRTHFGTYVQAVEGEEMPVIQTRNKKDFGTIWNAEYQDTPITAFGTVRGIKTAHGNYWAEGKTRLGNSVMTTTDKVSKLTEFSIVPVSDTKLEVYIISPTGKYATYNPLSSKITLNDEPSIYSEFLGQSIDDEFIGLLTGDGQWILTPPGKLGSVRVGSSVDSKNGGSDWKKIERFSEKESYYHIVSEFGTAMQVTGPPLDQDAGSHPIVTNVPSGLGIEYKWEFEAGSGNIDGLLSLMNGQ